MRYIDADELIEFFDSYPDHIEFDVEDIKSIINEQDAADVVEVVRCKDCKYHYSWKDVDDCFYHACERWGDNLGYDADVDVNYFCSFGERAEE